MKKQDVKNLVFESGCFGQLVFWCGLILVAYLNTIAWSFDKGAIIPFIKQFYSRAPVLSGWMILIAYALVVVFTFKMNMDEDYYSGIQPITFLANLLLSVILAAIFLAMLIATLACFLLLFDWIISLLI
jgi:hypothetical protein